MSTHHPTFGTSSGIGSVFKSLTKSFKPSSSITKDVPVTINPTVVGGDQNLQKILNQSLSDSTSPPARLEALEQLTESIQRFSLSSIQEIWYLVRHFCDLKQPRNIRRQAFKLCIVCIEKDDNSIGARTRYFSDIYKYTQFTRTHFDPEFKLILRALSILSKDGHDIHDFIIFDDHRNLIRWLTKGIDTLVSVSNNIKEQQSDVQISNCVELLHFATNCLKFNHATLKDFANASVPKLTSVQTVDEQLLQAIVDFFNCLTSFRKLRSDNISQIIKYLAMAHEQTTDSSLKKRALESVENMCDETTSLFICSTLCGQISDPSLKQLSHETHFTPAISICLGSLDLIELLRVRLRLEKSKLEFPSFLYLRSIVDALHLKIPSVNRKILQILATAFMGSFYKQYFETDSTGLFNDIFPFQIWYYDGCSLFNVLEAVTVNGDEDKYLMENICDSIKGLYQSHELTIPKDKMLELFVKESSYISEDVALFVLQGFQEEKSCLLLNPLWHEASLRLLNHFYYANHSVTVRQKCLEVIYAAFKMSLLVFESKNYNYDIFLDIFKESSEETDENLLQYLCGDILATLLAESSSDIFFEFTSLLKPLFEKKQAPRNEIIMSRGYMSSKPTRSTPKASAIFLVNVTRAICTAFTISSGSRKEDCYNVLISIANATQNGEVLLTIAKCLIRLRVTAENYIYMTNPQDMVGLASAFKRDNVTPAAGQLWTYPETVDFIPNEYLNKPKENLQILSPSVNEHNSDIYFIDVKKWFNVVLHIMGNFVEWEVYSYVWAHFCSQLSNMQLFRHCEEEILEFKTIVCNQLILKLPQELVFPKSGDLTKADLQVALVRTFSSLIGYHDSFSKTDEDQITSSLIFGLGSWEKTAIPCINILTICCYEIPLSIKKYLTLILTKLQTRITSANASTHTLEFLSSLVHLPVLVSDFTMEEFKRVFGIAFKYIQYARDIELRNPDHLVVPNVQQHGVDAEVEVTPSTKTKGVSSFMSQYILILSYNVISSWFLKIEMSERKKISSFLIKQLIASDELSESEQLGDHTIGFLDFVRKFTFSDLPLKVVNSTKNRQNSDDDRTVLNRWMVGCSVVSIETEVHSGDTEILIRKPTGVSKLIVQLDHETEASKKSPEVIDPNYYLLQLFDSKLKPIPVLEDTIISRGLAVLDRIPSVEFHKIGIVYVGEGQSTENEVFLNKVGSLNYLKFLDKIGDLVKLKKNKDIYTGGLDTESDLDGEYARCWSSKLTQVIFHITTMMHREDPTTPIGNGLISSTIENQKIIDTKKRHIGNNYVNIFFDESGSQDFNFNLIKSQFNFLNIVISPQTIQTKKSTSLLFAPQNGRKFFKVKTFRRAGVPAVFATCHFKLVSEDQLPYLVRSIAILASEFANVWHASDLSGKYVTNWAQRVKQLRLLYDKSLENVQKEKDHDLSNENFEQSALAELYNSFEFNSYTL
ncbi:Tsc2 GTPase-activating protein [Candida orthopsilosis Co 90-125]|uniref:Tsc2 GTPase-activating protein n=1 Tax=Candida orthopsilosis (strain 90-125) TaxID=1136231 RepID=H8WZG6_CANO9|nr:Tsc2 GTPase-activating protein [Candida orthopsilosis Co 90-125]CCG21834.1 Tsc2 GTPase-activating protein [Candida orthopsilosis Co 90-125]